MIRLIVHNETPQKREVIGRRNGQTYTFFEQKATAYLGDEVRNVRLSHSRADDCIKPGTYALDAEKSIRVDNYGALTLKANLALTPVVAGQK